MAKKQAPARTDKLALNSDEVSALMSHLSDEARSRHSGFVYNPSTGELTVPAEHEAAVKAAMATEAWRVPNPLPTALDKLRALLAEHPELIGELTK